MNKEFVEMLRATAGEKTWGLEQLDRLNEMNRGLVGRLISWTLTGTDGLCDGESVFFKRLGLSKANALVALNKAGVGHNRPFSVVSWKASYEQVLEALLKMTPSDYEVRGADLRRASLYASDLSYMDCRGTDFEGATLDRCFMNGGDFRGANFKWAKMKTSSLAQTRCEGANFEGADLRGAVMRGVIFDEETKFEGARMSDE